MPVAGAKLRKAYVNLNYPYVVLRFEDGMWKEVTAVPLDSAFDAFWA